MRRALLGIVAGAGVLLALAACTTSTRIQGAVTLGSGLEAPDTNRHTLYIAAFPAGSVVGNVLDTAAVAVFVEFGGIANSDFNPDVTYALGGAGAARAVDVIAWWKINEPELLVFTPPAAGDLFGVYPMNPVFPGATGSDGGGSVQSVDLVLSTSL